MGITVLLVDSSEVVRQCMRRVLNAEQDIEIVGEACGQREAFKLTEELRPQMTVLGISVTNCTAVTNIQMKARWRQQISSVLSVSKCASSEIIEIVCDSGVVRLIDKLNLFDELASSIRALAWLPAGFVN